MADDLIYGADTGSSIAPSIFTRQELSSLPELPSVVDDPMTSAMPAAGGGTAPPPPPPPSSSAPPPPPPPPPPPAAVAAGDYVRQYL